MNQLLVVGWIISLCLSKYVAVEYLDHLEVENLLVQPLLYVLQAIRALTQHLSVQGACWLGLSSEHRMLQLSA